MPIEQSHSYDSALFPRRPSMLRVFGEAIIQWADRREAAYAARQRRRSHVPPQELPGYLRRDLGLGPLPEAPNYWDRW